MKKFLAMVLGMVMVLSMVGCGKSDTPTTTDTTTSVSTESSVEVSTETPTEVIPHTESDQTSIEVVESTIDKENACAVETIYFEMANIPSVNITYPTGSTETLYIQIPSQYAYGVVPKGTKMKCDVYYFKRVVQEEGYEEIIDYTYEYEISLAE